MSSSVSARSVSSICANVVAAGKLSRSTIVYVIQVELDGKSWWVSRRYSEFKALKKAIQATLALDPCNEMDNGVAVGSTTLQFPKKTMWLLPWWIPQQLIDSKAKALDQFLQTLIVTTAGLMCSADCQTCELVKQFLLVYTKTSARATAPRQRQRLLSNAYPDPAAAFDKTSPSAVLKPLRAIGAGKK